MIMSSRYIVSIDQNKIQKYMSTQKIRKVWQSFVIILVPTTLKLQKYLNQNIQEMNCERKPSKILIMMKKHLFIIVLILLINSRTWGDVSVQSA